MFKRLIEKIKGLLIDDSAFLYFDKQCRQNQTRARKIQWK